jgi:hypothetical protein
MGAHGSDLLWINIFMFKSDRGHCESSVWRKYAQLVADVHRLGCTKQQNDRTAGRNSTYFGALTGNVGKVRGLRSKKGGRFIVVHKPDEGIQHAHIAIENPATLSKADRTELRILIRAEFTEKSEHQCPETTAN